MSVTVYSQDADLVKLRPNIMDMGVDDWTFKHEEAFAFINRTLVHRWFKTAAADLGYDYRETTFSPDNVVVSELTQLSCYKTLELVYIYLMNDAPEADGFDRQRKIFRDLYNEELKNILAIGLSYDWDADGNIASSEKYIHYPRRLVRV